MESGIIFIIIIIILAWLYDFYNGANDCANSIATIVSTRGLTFYQATFLASVFNFAGAFLTTEVAKTIGKGIVFENFITPLVIISALIGAIVWTIFATHSGIPISITHAIIGGIIGAGISSHGFSSINWFGLKKIIIGMITSPLGGFLGGLILIIILFHLFKNWRPDSANFLFKKAQLFSSSFVALSHGTNDTQNAMGIITIALLSVGFIDSFKVPFWVIFGSAFFMGIGTFYGGKKVIKTIGMKIIQIKPIHGFAAETASAGIIFIASFLGIPISTTHIVSTSVMGVGCVKKISAVRWGIVKNIFITWILTIPITAIIGGIIYYLLHLIF